MPPKAKVSKEDILNACISLVRKNGKNAFKAREIAKELNCSTQPIFSNFKSMEELKAEALRYATKVYNAYQEKLIKSGKYPDYKALGMGYIMFAKEQSELFKLLFMRDRRYEKSADLIDSDFEKAIATVMKSTGLNRDDASIFHFEMWAFTHGIAAILATSFLEFDYEVIDKMLTHQFEGMVMRFKKGNKIWKM